MWHGHFLRSTFDMGTPYPEPLDRWQLLCVRKVYASQSKDEKRLYPTRCGFWIKYQGIKYQIDIWRRQVISDVVNHFYYVVKVVKTGRPDWSTAWMKVASQTFNTRYGAPWDWDQYLQFSEILSRISRWKHLVWGNLTSTLRYSSNTQAILTLNMSKTVIYQRYRQRRHQQLLISLGYMTQLRF